jgi:hypothetical protein
MGSKNLIIAGNGETTRVNVEALLEDYFRGNGKDFMLFLPFKDRPSQGQVWAHQLANEMDIPTTVVAPEGAILMSITSSSLVTAADPIKTAVETAVGGWASAFLLWDEGDVFTATLLSTLKEASVPAYDLCKGLLEVSAGTTPVEPQKAVEEVLDEAEPELKVVEETDLLNIEEFLIKAVTKAVREALAEFENLK